MAELVRFSKQGAIGVITVDNPPVNALSPGVPEGIIECLEKGLADDGVKAMVLHGAGRSFIAGADIKHVGKPRTEAANTYRPRILASPKPVVAAIHGFALGGGLETALACHYRIATESAKVGLPEVLIGILPGGGGTQRLPRLIGVKPALEMIVSGRHVPAPEAKALGVLDDVVPDDKLLERAIAFAEKIADKRPLPRVDDDDSKLQEARSNPAVFEEMRQKIARRARNQIAPYQCIRCVEAAVALPIEDGLKRERELFQEIVNGEEAKALRYAFFAEREVAKIPDIGKDTPVKDIRKAAVVGAGTMGGGIAMCFADFGIPVTILEMSQEALDKGISRIRSNYETSVKRGSLDAAEVPKRMGCIRPSVDYDDIADADIVIEAVFEQMDVKKQVFAKLDKVMNADAIMASNTSTLDIDEIASATTRPEKVIGAHFFSPANVMKLLEIVRGKKSSKETVATLLKLSRRIGKIGGVCGNCDGFLANRSRAPLQTEMNILIEEGATPEQVDRVMYDFGYPMGPFAVGDLAGLDIGYAVRQRRKKESPNEFRSLPIPDRLCEMGRFGQKTRAGWYRYEEGNRKPIPDPEVDRIIAEVRKEMGIEARTISDEEVLQRLLLASVNEAAKILEEGIAYRASDVDVMWLYGFGFPRYRGGLMYWADTTLGIKKVHDTLVEWQGRFGDRWRPANLIKEKAEKGESFTGR